MRILLLEDKLGITDGYRHHWESMVMAAGLSPRLFTIKSIYRVTSLSRVQLMLKKGNRKTPGFNPDIMDLVGNVVRSWIQAFQPDMIVCQDLVCLGLVEPSWDIATIDNMRGGVYEFEGIQFVITPPISAINTKKSPKDIKAMNDGAADKDEWDEEEHEEEELFVEPYTIPFGKWVLAADLRKIQRLLGARA